MTPERTAQEAAREWLADVYIRGTKTGSRPSLAVGPGVAGHLAALLLEWRAKGAEDSIKALDRVGLERLDHACFTDPVCGDRACQMLKWCIAAIRALETEAKE